MSVNSLLEKHNIHLAYATKQHRKWAAKHPGISLEVYLRDHYRRKSARTPPSAQMTSETEFRRRSTWRRWMSKFKVSIDFDEWQDLEKRKLFLARKAHVVAPRQSPSSTRSLDAIIDRIEQEVRQEEHRERSSAAHELALAIRRKLPQYFQQSVPT